MTTVFTTSASLILAVTISFCLVAAAAHPLSEQLRQNPSGLDMSYVSDIVKRDLASHEPTIAQGATKDGKFKYGDIVVSYGNVPGGLGYGSGYGIGMPAGYGTGLGIGGGYFPPPPPPPYYSNWPLRYDNFGMGQHFYGRP